MTLSLVDINVGLTANDGSGDSLRVGGQKANQNFAILRRQREVLTAARTYYVSLAGSNSNDGLSPGSSFQTIQHAVDVALFNLDTGGNTVVIQLADGVYDLAGDTIGVYLPPLGGGSVYVRGNLATPANVVVKTTDNYVFDVEEFADIRIEGMELQCLGSGGWACVAAFNQSIVRLNNIRFGSCPGSDHILSAGFSNVLMLSAPIFIVGDAGISWHATSYGHIGINKAVTLVGSRTFSYFAYVEDSSNLLLSNGTSFSGPAATGTRAHVDTNSTIFVESSVPGYGGATTLPGSRPVEITQGGIYEGVVSARQPLFEDRNYYVSTSGNDANDGLTSGSAFRTIQHAIDVSKQIEFFGHAAIINLAPGTYTEVVDAGEIGNVIVQGTGTLPSDVVVTCDSNYCFTTYAFASTTGNLALKHLKLTTTGTGGIAVGAFDFSKVDIYDVEFGAMAGSNTFHLQAAGFASIRIKSNYTISGGAFAHVYAVNFGKIEDDFSSPVCTLVGTPNFVTFFFAESFGYFDFETITYSGAATGTRYGLLSNSLIYGHLATTLPGNQPGFADNSSTIFPEGQRQYVMTLVNGANNNVPWVSGQKFSRVTGPTAAFNITGFPQPNPLAGDSQTIEMSVHNPTAQTMTIRNANAGSTAVNQILTNTGADVAITGPGVANFYYSQIDQRWILIGHQP
jgi:hypothetical protein